MSTGRLIRHHAKSKLEWEAAERARARNSVIPGVYAPPLSHGSSQEDGDRPLTLQAKADCSNRVMKKRSSYWQHRGEVLQQSSESLGAFGPERYPD